ncbi:serine/threonine-protein kinase [Mycobacterium shimoidei]|uniref:serine/threonine-protein kinase n=1 Tax=Mycobacterium shimoidei TaxID=29313 RepID=UPI0008493BD3|nr:serine/threonine-protein kinase [Mycobacterium shimoidei]MCV7259235.1 serine/threonine protein kinase [Mycobacterium shimoidei]ODR13295.1 protein kinase [Mycobacterium shimoidei]ORW79633.1 protein kinase [Mycobacterium shimoidei]
MVDAGEILDGYVIDREVGRGGHATVYRADALRRPGRPVALKVLDADRRNPAQQARLNREFRLVHRLHHPHIVAMYEQGDFWLAMQFLDGGKSTGLQSRPERLATLAQIADALDYLHGEGIVHSDVKPANILVAKDFSRGGACLIDFSVAHAVVDNVFRRPTDLQASLSYAAPELLRGRAPTAATDEYALACTAVELLTGAPPYEADTSTELVRAHLRGIAPRLSPRMSWASRSLDTVIARAMARDPEMRYQCCSEFVEHLSRALKS